jgi:hypothetical protein
LLLSISRKLFHSLMLLYLLKRYFQTRSIHYQDLQHFPRDDSRSRLNPIYLQFIIYAYLKMIIKELLINRWKDIQYDNHWIHIPALLYKSSYTFWISMSAILIFYYKLPTSPLMNLRAYSILFLWSLASITI